MGFQQLNKVTSSSLWLQTGLFCNDHRWYQMFWFFWSLFLEQLLLAACAKNRHAETSCRLKINAQTEFLNKIRVRFPRTEQIMSLLCIQKESRRGLLSCWELPYFVNNLAFPLTNRKAKCPYQ